MIDGDEGFEEAAVELVEAEGVDFFDFEGGVGEWGGDDTVAVDLGVIADATEESIGDAGGAAAAMAEM